MFKKTKLRKQQQQQKWPDAAGVEPQTIYIQDQRIIDCASANSVKHNL